MPVPERRLDQLISIEMNIVQLHERVRFWIDAVASTRFEIPDINNAINAAIESKTLETYEQSLPMNRSDSFQRTQKAREILAPLINKAVVGTTGFILTGNKIEINIAQNYPYNLLVSLKVEIDGAYYDCEPLTYDRKNRISRSPFRRPRLTPSAKVYYIEESGGINIIHSHSAAITNFELYYIRKLGSVGYGIEYDHTASFAIGNRLLVLADTVYNGYLYLLGNEIIIIAGHLSITSGLVTFGYIECPLPEFTHEEIARRAAINCLMSAGQGEKAKLIREEITAS